MASNDKASHMIANLWMICLLVFIMGVVLNIALLSLCVDACTSQQLIGLEPCDRNGGCTLGRVGWGVVCAEQ